MKKYRIIIEQKQEVNLLELVADSGFLGLGKVLTVKNQKPLNIDELQEVLLCHICYLSEETMPSKLFSYEAANNLSILKISYSAFFDKTGFSNEALKFGFETMVPLVFLAYIEIALENNTTIAEAETWARKHIDDYDEYVISYQFIEEVDLELVDTCESNIISLKQSLDETN